jgi:hypothetical protein
VSECWATVTEEREREMLTEYSTIIYNNRPSTLSLPLSPYSASTTWLLQSTRARRQSTASARAAAPASARPPPPLPPCRRPCLRACRRPRLFPLGMASLFAPGVSIRRLSRQIDALALSADAIQAPAEALPMPRVPQCRDDLASPYKQSRRHHSSLTSSRRVSPRCSMSFDPVSTST